MGNTCCTKRGIYLKNKSNLCLEDKINNLDSHKKSNVSFIILYSGITITTIFVVCSGGSAGILFTSVSSTALIIYYSFELINNNKQIDNITDILDKRNDAEVYFIESNIVST